MVKFYLFLVSMQRTWSVITSQAGQKEEDGGELGGKKKGKGRWVVLVIRRFFVSLLLHLIRLILNLRRLRWFVHAHICFVFFSSLMTYE